MSNRFQMYLADTIKLVESLIIKSEDTINAMNQWVIDYYGKEAVNLNDPTSWKYYYNVCGEYHFSDPKIVVTSWDTLEEIEFTKRNLEIHPTLLASSQMFFSFDMRSVVVEPSKLSFGLVADCPLGSFQQLMRFFANVLLH